MVNKLGILIFILSLGCPLWAQDFGGLEELKKAGTHGETIKAFKEFHDQLHLINGFISKKEYDSIRLILPFLKGRKEILLKEERRLATAENEYGIYLDNFSKAADEFIAIYEKGEMQMVSQSFNKIHTEYYRVKQNRPATEEVKVFKDFHADMLKIRQLLEKGQYQAIKDIIPHFNEKTDILLREEKKLSTEQNNYALYLKAFSWNTKNFIKAYEAKQFESLPRIFQTLYDEFEKLKRYRPTQAVIEPNK